MTRIRISAIIPVFNGARFVQQAVDSVLAQTRPVDELILVDDGSTDASWSILRANQRARRHVLLAHQHNRGIGAAQNAGVRLATGELVTFLDQDDLWLPEKTALQEAHMVADPAIAALSNATLNFLEPGDARPAQPPADHTPGERNGIYFGAMMFRRSALDAVGPFNERFGMSVDLDWHFRALRLGVRPVRHSALVLRRRLHANNLTNDPTLVRSAFVHMVRDALDQRRGGHG